LEQATRSDRFADLVALTVGLQATLRGAYERATADALHRANLPAWSDLVRLSLRLASLERRVADLSVQLDRAWILEDADRRGTRRRSTGDGRTQGRVTRVSEIQRTKGSART
jgi:hypothetical protein